jgi:hypothetical protein
MIAYGIYLQIAAWLWFPLFLLSGMWISRDCMRSSLGILSAASIRATIFDVTVVCLIRVAFLICLLAEQFKC